MNGTVSGLKSRSKSIRATVARLIVKLVRFVWRAIIFPIRLILVVRRALTPASVTLLLIGIVSTNIIWGYPWIGVFSACFSLLSVGFVLNRWSLPRLESDFVAPRSAVAGSPFHARMILINPSWLPALELDVVAQQLNRRRSKRLNPFETQIRGHRVSIIHPGGRYSLQATLLCPTRGIHRLPDALVTSWFPFHLFKYARRVKTTTKIPITPRPLTAEDDVAANGLLDSLGNWTRKLLSGDALDYTGSREYVPGMPVRRWDFLSWARLGQPIIREYQSPSVRTITIVVDTATDPEISENQSQSALLLERVLSIAATVVEHICRQPIQIKLFVTGQTDSMHTESRADRESLLIRLAAANHEAATQASHAIGELCDQNDRTPILIVTSRMNPMGDRSVLPAVSILRTDLEAVVFPALDHHPHQVQTV